MESPARFTETLEHILHFLRTEGFYAAEDALRGEIENRFPEGASPVGTASSSPALPSAARALSDDPGAPFTQTFPDVPAAAGEAREDGRDVSGPTPLVLQTQSSHSPSHSRGLSWEQSVSSPSHSAGSRTFDEVDEYSDDGDVGYVRKRVTHQQAFIARELDLSDEDGSAKGTSLYQQARGQGVAQQWEDGQERASSTSSGKGSSYFSGEVPPVGKESPLHQQLSGSGGSLEMGTAGSDRVVTITAPVLPTGAAAAPPLQKHSSAGSTPSSPPEPKVFRMPSIGHELSPKASQEEEPADLPPLPSVPVRAAPAEAPQSPSAPPHPLESSSSLPRYLDPLGVFGRMSEVLSGHRRSSANLPSESSQSTLPPQPATPPPHAAAAAPPPQREEGASLPSYAGAGVEQGGLSPEALAREAGVPTPFAAGYNNSMPAIDPPGTPPAKVQTGMAEGKAGGEAFSFPVTPVAEAPAPADTVFSAWPSFHKKRRQGPGQHGEVGLASSSGYTSDDEASTDAAGAVTNLLGAQIPQHEADITNSLDDVVHKLEAASLGTSSVSSPSSLPRQGPPAPEPSARETQAHISSARPDSQELTAAGEAPPSTNSLPALKPLDMSISLPPLGCIDISSALMQRRKALLSAADRDKIDAINEVAALPSPSGASPSEHQATSPSIAAAHVQLQPIREGSVATPGAESLLSRAELQQTVRGEADLGPTLQHREATGEDAGEQPGEEVQGEASAAHQAPGVMAPMARHESDTSEGLVYQWDEDWVERRYEVMHLRVIHRRRRTGFEETKDFPIRINELIAGRYQVMDFLGSAAFSKAVQALDIKTGMLVCLKIVKNNKDYFDQSLDEIKLLRYANEADPGDEHNLLRLYDYFYYKEHLFLVCELLRANLYEFQKYNRNHSDEPYFTLPRVQRIATQVLQALAFMHSLDLIHSDLKPENILIKSYSRCEVKVIDLGSSCFTSDHLSSYVQSRSYRAPEVILGLPYDQKIDVWSLGCILAELLTGYVLLQNDSLATLLARMQGILGNVPPDMLQRGRFSHRYFTRSALVFERSPRTGCYDLLHSKRTSLRARVPEADVGFLAFLSTLLAVDPVQRPTAREALQHPWLSQPYSS